MPASARRRCWHPNTCRCSKAIGDPTLTVALSFAAIVMKHESGEVADMLRWSQQIIDLVAGDQTVLPIAATPTKNGI